MLVAVKFGHDAPVDMQGNLLGSEAGVTLVRRLLRVFEGSVLIGREERQCNGFKMVPIRELSPETVIINMDVDNSLELWRKRRALSQDPRIMNFVWWSTSDYQSDLERAEAALSCALFPTFCNSERTFNEIGNLVRQWTIQPLSERAKSAWVNLGVHLERRTEQVHTPEPVVLYPAIYMNERKQPKLFCEIVDKVAKHTPIRVEARLAESQLATDSAMWLSRQKWAWVGPMTKTREEYWQALARTTAFVATAVDESYGLEYVEALAEGVIGIFPDHAWVGPLLPKGYPFIYHNAAEAEQMLRHAVTEPEACRAEMDRCAGGNFPQWVADQHNDDDFEAAIVNQVHAWFG